MGSGPGFLARDTGIMKVGLYARENICAAVYRLSRRVDRLAADTAAYPSDIKAGKHDQLRATRLP
jgi:hypothetical protein